MTVLIGGVGYTFLRDHSVGLEVIQRLAALSWPDDVRIEDVSYGPVAAVHHFREILLPDDRVILIGAAKRGRTPGEVYHYRWEGILPEDAEVQARVVEAVTGVISLDNLLIVATRFGALPRDVLVVEVEPEDESWGAGFTPAVEQAIDTVIATVRQELLGSEVLG